jgi:hypothetical protein
MASELVLPVASKSWSDYVEDEPLPPITSEESSSRSEDSWNVVKLKKKKAPVHAPVIERKSYPAVVHKSKPEITRVDDSSAKDIYDRTIFIVGTQGFDETSLRAFLLVNGATMSALAILYNHQTMVAKPFALGICQTKEMAEALYAAHNLYNPENQPISFRPAEPFQPRAGQDPYSIVITGTTAESALSMIRPLGNPTSFTHRKNGITVNYRDEAKDAPPTIRAYLATQLFDGKVVGSTRISVVLANNSRH